MLDSAGFVLFLGPKGRKEVDDIKWKSKFDELRQHKRKQNHCNVPQNEGSLGGWVNRQRKAFRKDTLSDERKAMLNSAGFAWTVAGTKEGQHDKRWKSKFDKLKEYKRERNHCNVPQNDAVLGTWVSTQRAAFKKDELSDEREGMLNSVGFVWATLAGRPPRR